MMVNVTVVKDSNASLTQTMEMDVLYYGVNGFGITWSYFVIHFVLLLVAIVGLFLNSSVFYIVRLKMNNADNSQIFIYNLALSDAINSVFCIYTVVYNLVHFKNYYECAFRGGLTTCVNLNSSIHLMSLTFDRYFKVKFPFAYGRVFQEERMHRFSKGVWLFSAVLAFLPIAGWRNPHSVHGTNYCSYFGVLTKGYLSLLIILFFVNYSIVLFCYVNMLWIARIQRTKINYLATFNHHNGSDRCTIAVKSAKPLWWRPTKTVLLVVSLYAFCLIPTAIFLALHLTGATSELTNDEKGSIFAYLISMVYLLIVGHPLIYAIKSDNIRHSLKTHLPRIALVVRLCEKMHSTFCCRGRKDRVQTLGLSRVPRFAGAATIAHQPRQFV